VQATELDPTGLLIGNSCLTVKPSLVPTMSPTVNGQVAAAAAAAEAVGAALGLRGAAA
jgi:hypothetical protein